jgi:cysteinyl-tRNA synthetase
MILYDTLSRTKKEVVSIHDDKTIGLYACGPTVYDYTHIGHLRKFTMDDVLIRALRAQHIPLKFVRNITDVGHLVSDDDAGEDKMEKGARKYNKTVWEVAHDFEDYFWKSMDAMNILRPDVSCRATEHIPQQIVLIQKLEKKGYTYTISDGVYFDSSKMPDYGELAQLDKQERMAAARVEMVPGKKNPTDFALWKFSPKDEKRQMEWESPWGVGFPGWHIECSAMSMEYLGEQFEIHTGGIDHVSIHHPNEIAQSECATGKKPFVRIWMHHNFLNVEGQKISKSLNNFLTIDDIFAKHINPMALRLMLLGAHYRSEFTFRWANLEATQGAYDKLVSILAGALAEKERTTLTSEKDDKINQYRERFWQNINNDLQTPEAIALLWEVVKSNIPGQDKYDLVMSFDEVLGLDLSKAVDNAGKTKVEIPSDIQELADQRWQLKKSGKFDESDAIRKQIEEKGWVIKDFSDSFVMKKK